MDKITEILSERADKAKQRLESDIQDQKRELATAKSRVVNTLLGIDNCSRFSIREQFTYVAKIEDTLGTMLTFYKEIYGIEYQDPIPAEPVLEC